jgi:hypothetical protein
MQSRRCLTQVRSLAILLNAVYGVRSEGVTTRPIHAPIEVTS